MNLLKENLFNYPINLDVIGSGFSAKCYKINDHICWKIYNLQRMLELEAFLEFDYSTIEERVNALVNMCFPEWAIKPINIIKDFRGVVGYEMPYINGINLTNLSYKPSEKILQQIDNIIIWCSDNQFFADFSFSNFIIDSNYKVWMCDLESAKFKHYKQIFIPHSESMFTPIGEFPEDYFSWSKSQIRSYFEINNHY